VSLIVSPKTAGCVSWTLSAVTVDLHGAVHRLTTQGDQHGRGLGMHCTVQHCIFAHAECTKWGKPDSITQERSGNMLQLANHGSLFSDLEGTMSIIGDGLHACTQGQKQKKKSQRKKGTIWWSVVGIAGYHGHR
jgi:hypothetical protein